MRPPRGGVTSCPGSPVAGLEQGRLRGMHVEFYDPAGAVHGIPTYPWQMAPGGLATMRQLRAAGLRPRGQDIQAQIIWWHGSGNGRTRRVAYLYRIDLAKPKRTASPSQMAAICRAISARMTCKSCGNWKPYCISKSLGECNDCAAAARAA